MAGYLDEPLDLGSDEYSVVEEDVIYYAFRNGRLWCESSRLEEVKRSAQIWDTEADEVVGTYDDIVFKKKVIVRTVSSSVTWEEID